MNTTLQKTVLYILSSLLLLGGAIAYVQGWELAPYAFTLGAVGQLIYRIVTPYRGENRHLRALYRQVIFSTLFFIASGVLMFLGRSEWFMLLAAAALIQLYTSFRIPYMEKREK